jgi:hypothetical protein
LLGTVFTGTRNGTLLIYFSGHGLLTRKGDLYLALKDTHSRRLASSAFPAYKFIDLISEYHISNLLLVLDCCYASAAADSLGVSLDTVAPTLDLLHKRDAEALTIIAASARRDIALAGNRSVFTESFVASARALLESGKPVVVSELCEEIALRMDGLGLGQQLGVYASPAGKATVILDVLPANRRISDRISATLLERMTKQRSTVYSVVAHVVENWEKVLLVPDDWTLIRTSRRLDIFSRPIGWRLYFILVGPDGIATCKNGQVMVYPADDILDVKRQMIPGRDVNTYEVGIVDLNSRVIPIHEETILANSSQSLHWDILHAIREAVVAYKRNRKEAELDGI